MTQDYTATQFATTPFTISANTALRTEADAAPIMTEAALIESIENGNDIVNTGNGVFVVPATGQMVQLPEEVIQNVMIQRQNRNPAQETAQQALRNQQNKDRLDITAVTDERQTRLDGIIAQTKAKGGVVEMTAPEAEVTAQANMTAEDKEGLFTKLWNSVLGRTTTKDRLQEIEPANENDLNVEAPYYDPHAFLEIVRTETPGRANPLVAELETATAGLPKVDLGIAAQAEHDKKVNQRLLDQKIKGEDTDKPYIEQRILKETFYGRN
ncbi:MAG: hypothetical protein ACTSXQ_05060 [Alphaproteobacteria bacterium]